MVSFVEVFLGMYVSVIIPVLDDSERLAKCLGALQNQTYPQNLYQVIVVDNGSKEDIRSLVQQFSQATFTHESKPGSYSARNQGITLAQGDILAFTDSDCIPESDWIEKGVHRLTNTPNCGLVAGKITLFYQDPEHPTPVELYESIKAFPQKKYVEERNFGVTANLFTFRHVIESIGQFDCSLKSSGDLEWGNRVFSAGYQQVYADDVCIRHPARHTYRELHKKITRVLVGKYGLLEQDRYPLTSFLKISLMDFKNSTKDINDALKSIELTSSKDKLKVMGIMLLVRLTRIWERTKLQLKI